MDLADLITLLGGVAMFLFGMSLMGDGLKKVAGNKLELILYRLSNTPLKGILLGTGVTAVIQSSSATSVMVVESTHVPSSFKTSSEAVSRTITRFPSMNWSIRPVDSHRPNRASRG